MKIEVKDYHGVCEMEGYWRGMFIMADEDNVQKIFNEMKEWWRLRKHLEELAEVKEEDD